MMRNEKRIGDLNFRFVVNESLFYQKTDSVYSQLKIDIENDNDLKVKKLIGHSITNEPWFIYTNNQLSKSEEAIIRDTLIGEYDSRRTKFYFINLTNLIKEIVENDSYLNQNKNKIKYHLSVFKNKYHFLLNFNFKTFSYNTYLIEYPIPDHNFRKLKEKIQKLFYYYSKEVEFYQAFPNYFRNFNDIERFLSETNIQRNLRFIETILSNQELVNKIREDSFSNIMREHSDLFGVLSSKVYKLQQNKTFSVLSNQIRWNFSTKENYFNFNFYTPEIIEKEPIRSTFTHAIFKHTNQLKKVKAFLNSILISDL